VTPPLLRAGLTALVVFTMLLFAGCQVAFDCARDSGSQACRDSQTAAQQGLQTAVAERAAQAQQTAEAYARAQANQLVDQAKQQAATAAARAQATAAAAILDTVRGVQSGQPPTGDFAFVRLPVELSDKDYVNWYGNTEFAFAATNAIDPTSKDRKPGIYDRTQGLHSGIDFVVPNNTTIVNPVNATGKVVNRTYLQKDQQVNEPGSWGAGPYSILLDYGSYRVLFGHMSPMDFPEMGKSISVGETVGRTGKDENNLYHLHLEVIPPGTDRSRVNPVPFFTVVRPQLDARARGDGAAFHPREDGQWQTPDSQPDIHPCGPLLNSDLPGHEDPC
jgi:murein DD-endopeptidase MepM/ murein hydrolase activator NlpD